MLWMEVKPPKGLERVDFHLIKALGTNCTDLQS